jgi:hypothetical protein
MRGFISGFDLNFRASREIDPPNGSLFRQADVAQLVEQRIRNAKVGGSTPLIGTIS